MHPYFIKSFTANASVEDSSGPERDALQKILYDKRCYENLFNFLPGQELALDDLLYRISGSAKSNAGKKIIWL